VLPQPSFWWLNHYAGFRRHLEERYRLIVRANDTAAIWSLAQKPKAGARNLTAQFAEVIAEFQARRERDPVILDWQTGSDLKKSFPQLTIFQPTAEKNSLPYLDRTADLVVVAVNQPAHLAEARRVASAAVVRVDAKKKTLAVEWQPDFSSAKQTSVSIVMPCYNGAAMTDACVRSLLETLPRSLDVEVIVVDDCATDGTAAMLKRWARRDARVKYVRNKKNLGFVDTCNFGAAQATGDILVFLNNDLALLPGWLEPLLRVFRERADAGVVGGKLIFPDGTFQEAGGVVFRDGSAMNYGRTETDLTAPLFNFLREVDYCSGALFATPREFFQKLGGFDTEFRPGYYEDTDYCFRTRAAGRKVYVQPESAVVHREGGTAGLDTTKGMKRYQVVNHGKFLARWRMELTKQSPRPHREDFAARLALSVRDPAQRRVLVCALMPECDRDSGSRRVFDTLVFLQEAGWAVTFVAQHEKFAPRYAQILERRGIAVFVGAGRWMKELIAGGDFDLAVFGLWHVAEPFVSALRTLSPRTRVVVDSIDLHFLRLARGTFLGGDGKLLDANYASEMMRELNTYAAADAVLTVSPKESNLINDLCADAALAHPVPDNEDLPVSPVPLSERRGLVFVGCFRHVPNVGAVEFLCKEILPRVKPALLARHPVHIIGDGLDDTVRAFGKNLPNVRMVGWTPTVEPYICHARATVIPLLFGAGTKRKALQALMLGTPTVSTSIGAEGFGLQDGREIFVANDAELFAQRITQLLEDDELWTRMAQAGREHIVGLHGRETARMSLAQVVAQVLGKPAKRTLLTQDAGEIKPGKLPHLAYSRLVTAFVDMLENAMPPGGKVVVASRGDDELLRIPARTGLHFPQTKDGVYAGHHPADCAAAIAQLEKLRKRGAEFFALPATAFWWLEHYKDFAAHLANNGQEMFRSESAGVIFDLRGAKKISLTPADDVVKLIAFHLPQFHPIPENDAWWGKGFTEWTNVRRAKPAFAGHHQPQVPGELGYYDLRDASARAAQAELARAHGVHGFCYYHYWFGGKRLLEKPVNEILASGQPDFPFCLCWANEPWSRRWDGQAQNILQPQMYSPEDDVSHIRWLLPVLADKRAIRIAGKPVFVVYQGRELPDPARTIATWRREVAAAGLPGIYLMSVETGWDAGWDATQVGFDAKILFAPQFTTLFNSGAEIKIPGKEKLRVFDYQKAWRVLANPAPVNYLRYETVCPAWDNSARRGDEAVVMHNSTPVAYEQWLRSAIARAKKFPAGERVVFLNAWNEWAEGTHLEPDEKFGRAYLEATKRALLGQGKTRK
jgi:GT2 family glycosyltransferase/glycosyltransferase involved in cell wall biosynthesis